MTIHAAASSTPIGGTFLPVGIEHHGGDMTPRWRETYSNPRSLSEGVVLEVEQNRLDERVLLHGGPRVRIHLPPAASQERTIAG
jgi:hypothetical protein